ncbi:hypothetical protein ACLESD_27120 [Pyxidicoccus sp. 3LFB2]
MPTTEQGPHPSYARASAFGFDASVADELIDWTVASINLEQREREIMAKLL